MWLFIQQKIPNAEERLPVMEKIEFEKVVATINYSPGENVTVTTRDGCEYSAMHVIFTGSLGVLKEKHSSMFVPPLSEKKQRAIEVLLDLNHKIKKHIIRLILINIILSSGIKPWNSKQDFPRISSQMVAGG